MFLFDRFCNSHRTVKEYSLYVGRILAEALETDTHILVDIRHGQLLAFQQLGNLYFVVPVVEKLCKNARLAAEELAKEVDKSRHFERENERRTVQSGIYVRE